MSKERFSSSNRMKIRFEKVLQRNFDGSSLANVKRAIESALGPIPYINWSINDSWAVIRSRSIDETKEDITNPNAFGSPPPVETSQGRANLVNHPVFYGTFDSRTAMQEIKVPLETECYVSIWEFSVKATHLTVFLDNVDARNDLSDIQSRIPSGLPKGLKGGYTEKSLRAALELRAGAFLSENYSFTSKIAHDVIYNSSASSVGLVYPSVVDPYRCNIAINPDFVGKHMQCVRIYKMVWSGAYIFRILARGTNVNGSIEWKDTGSYEMDELDRKYSGSNGPNEIHPSALKVLNEKCDANKKIQGDLD